MVLGPKAKARKGALRPKARAWALRQPRAGECEMKLPNKQGQAQTAGLDIANASVPRTGNRFGSLNSGDFIGQVEFWPVQNVELPATYGRFNGASHSYDGSGRDEVALRLNS